MEEIDFRAAAELLSATSEWVGNGRTKTEIGGMEVEVDNPLSVSPMGAPKNVTWPEQLLPAAMAACFITTMSSISERLRMHPEVIRVTVKPLLARDIDGGFKFEKMFITVEVSLPREEVSKAERLIELTHSYCLISKALKGNVEEIIETKVNEI